jgi:hypothetical protein
MTIIARLGALVGALLTLSLYAAPVHAQATRTWVSGVGNDADPCSRTAPCKTFAGAISKTAAFGEINCTDPGGFGAVTITKSISIICDYTEAGVLVSGTNAIIVNLPLGTDRVTLKGLDIEGLGTGIDGVRFIQNGVLHVHKVQIRGFRAAGGNGINFIPSGAASLAVADSYITDNGGSGTTAGIMVKPSGSGAANVSINRVALENNTNGVFADGTNSTGGINIVLANSSVHANSSNGVTSFTNASHSAVNVHVGTSIVSSNSGSGLNVNGFTATPGLGFASMRAGGSIIAHNAVGVSTVGAGVLQSFKTNQVAGNGTDGTPMAAFPGPGGTALQ